MVTGMFTPLRILTFSPHTTSATASVLATTLAAEADKYGVNSTLRVAHFMGQTFVESGGYINNVENLNYKAETIARMWPRLASRADALAHNPEALADAAYASYTDAQGHLHDQLGNGPEGNGNGWRYRGRGIIQLTGLANYTSMASKIGHDLVANPDTAAGWDVAALVALRFWEDKQCNIPADADNVAGVTQRINGGQNGFQDRVDATIKAKKVFV